MSKTKQFAARMAVVAGAALVVVASAFADSRPSNETSWRDGDRRDVRRDARDDERRGDDSRNGGDRDRYEGNGRHDRDDRDDRYERNGRNDRDRYERNDRNDRHRSNRQPHYARGRVSRVDRYRDGYRVWVGDARYPFYVPSRYYNRDRFRIGVVINIGGIYNDGGYYDYYDDRGYSRGDLRGTVERIDHRRDSFVIREHSTGSFVTVVSRESLRRLRTGDYVEIYGQWARRGLFHARDVDVLDRY